MSTADWLRADMDPDDPGSQGYSGLSTGHDHDPEPVMHTTRGGVMREVWYECPRCGEEMRLAPFSDTGPDRDLRCSECGYHYVD